MEQEEENVSETKLRQEGLMVCLMSSISLVGCWLGTVEVKGDLLPQDVGVRCSKGSSETDCPQSSHFFMPRSGTVELCLRTWFLGSDQPRFASHLRCVTFGV